MPSLKKTLSVKEIQAIKKEGFTSIGGGGLCLRIQEKHLFYDIRLPIKNADLF